MYKAEKERYNEHILELVQSWKRKCFSVAVFKLRILNMFLFEFQRCVKEMSLIK